MSFTLKSPVFQNDQFIPTKFTGEGEDVSPSLRWSGAPANTKSFVLICEDPDAPSTPEPFVHWLLFNISPTVSSIPEGLPKSQDIEVPVIASQGENSFGEIGYNGPLPPIGHGIHHYIFKLYALNAEISVPEEPSKEQILSAMEGKILDATQLIGKYERKSASQKKSA